MVLPPFQQMNYACSCLLTLSRILSDKQAAIKPISPLILCWVEMVTVSYISNIQKPKKKKKTEGILAQRTKEKVKAFVFDPFLLLPLHAVHHYIFS